MPPSSPAGVPLGGLPGNGVSPVCSGGATGWSGTITSAEIANPISGLSTGTGYAYLEEITSSTFSAANFSTSGQDITFTGSTNVVFSPAFRATPAIGVSLANMLSGQRYTITSKTNSGFTLTVYDSGGAVATNSVTLDYVAKGYGKGI